MLHQVIMMKRTMTWNGKKIETLIRFCIKKKYPTEVLTAFFSNLHDLKVSVFCPNGAVFIRVLASMACYSFKWVILVKGCETCLGFLRDPDYFRDNSCIAGLILLENDIFCTRFTRCMPRSGSSRVVHQIQLALVCLSSFLSTFQIGELYTV